MNINKAKEKGVIKKKREKKGCSMSHLSSNFSFETLVNLCRRTHEEMRSRANRSVDIAMVVRNWLIGWYIVEFEQTGADRAEYGSRLIDRLGGQAPN